MPSFKVTRKAREDLISIGQYTENEWGKPQRNSYLKQLDACFTQIAEAPEIGINCDFIKAGYRKFPQGSHLIFYRLDSESTVEIIRILHKRMDVISKLS